ncbi:MAG: glycosyltransferase family 4 protein [Burkholderiales bacterium]
MACADRKIRLAVNGTALLSQLTGIGQYTKHLMTEIEKRAGFELNYFYGIRWSNRLRIGALPQIGRIRTFLRTAIPKPYEVSRLIQGARFRAGLKRWPADLYHEPNFMPFRFDGPTVTTIHDMSYLRYPETHPKIRVDMMNRLLPKSVERSSHILTDSEFVRDEILSAFGVSPSKVHAVHLGASSDYRPMTAGQTRKCMRQYELIHGSYVLAVGTLEPRKNLVQALRAYRNLPAPMRDRYPLVVAGMKGWFSDKIEAEMRELEAKGQVRLLGYVPHELLPQLYAAASMLIYPSIYEGFGLPPLEAMASGIPVITSNQSSMPEVVGDAGYTIDPMDVEAMTAAMHEIVDATDQRQMRIARGLARAKLFSWERCAEQTLAVYDLALTGG